MKSFSSMRMPAIARQVSAGIAPWDLAELDVPAVADPAQLTPGDRELAETADPEMDAVVGAARREEDFVGALDWRRELEEMLEQEHSERDRLVHEAYERGMAEGRTEAEQREAARLGSALDAVDAALSEIRASGSRWASTLEENVCALAVAVARHILDREIDGDKLAVLSLVRSAVSKFGLAEPLTIRVSGRDYEVLAGAESDEDETAALIAGREVVWVADAAIGVGGCVVEGPDRIVDGRMDTALERVYRRLTQTHA